MRITAETFKVDDPNKAMAGVAEGPVVGEDHADEPQAAPGMIDPATQAALGGAAVSQPSTRKTSSRPSTQAGHSGTLQPLENKCGESARPRRRCCWDDLRREVR